LWKTVAAIRIVVDCCNLATLFLSPQHDGDQRDERLPDASAEAGGVAEPEAWPCARRIEWWYSLVSH